MGASGFSYGTLHFGFFLLLSPFQKQTTNGFHISTFMPVDERQGLAWVSGLWLFVSRRAERGTNPWVEVPDSESQ